MTGKQKCEILKQIRRDIASANEIPLDMPACTHTGECKGTCPRCESEVIIIERGLAERKKQGFKIAVAGISAGLIALNTTSCEIVDRVLGREVQLEGDMMMPITETSVDGEMIEPTAGVLPIVTEPPQTLADDSEVPGDLILPNEIDEGK